MNWTQQYAYQTVIALADFSPQNRHNIGDALTHIDDVSTSNNILTTPGSPAGDGGAKVKRAKLLLCCCGMIENNVASSVLESK